MSSTPWDLVVVGGGTAGLVGAHAAATIGARVALVERARTGGDCLWTGCVPSKALLSVATTVAQAPRAAPYTSTGRQETLTVDLAAVMTHVRSAIGTIEPVDSPEALRDAGVHVIHGDARFTDPRSVAVAGESLVFHRALLATGAAPRLPDVPGLAQARPLTTETVWDLRTLPGRLVVVGGGPAGCELAQGFARLGTRVTLIEAADRLLGREDPDAAAIVADALRADGVDVRLGVTVATVVAAPGQPGHVVVEAGGRDTEVEFDTLLVATGRRPRTDAMGLDRADVQLTASGAVAVDRRLRTSNPRIYAAGDVTPHPHLTHLAAYHAGIAVANALLGLRRGMDLLSVPRVTYTDPEVAAVGVPTWSPPGRRPPRTTTRHHDHVDRAVADGRTEGFSRLALSPRGTRVTGATLVGPRAGESIAELTVAVRRRMRLTELAATVHAYPTYGDGPWNAAVDEVRRRLSGKGARRAGRAALSARRTWMRWRPRAGS